MLATAGVLAAACGCSSSSGGASGPVPSITITSPMNGGTVMVTTSSTKKTAAIGFDLTNFTLMNPGSCGSAASTDNCGHIHVFVDGMACTPSGQPYNTAAIKNPAEAVLSDCPMVNGMHTALLELHHDDHSPITDSSGKTISATVSFTASGG